jgi:hypothetical protein
MSSTSGYAKYSGIGGGGGGAGSVTSVGLADGSTTPIFTITNSPVTSTGTLTETLIAQNANTVFSGPTTGSAAQPTFRALVSADIPSLAYANEQLSNLSGTTAVNLSLVPGSSTLDLGSSAGNQWRNGYFTGALFDGSGVSSVSVGGRQLKNAAGSLVFDWSGTLPSFNNVRVTNVADPLGSQDAMTLAYANAHYGTGSGTITALTGDVTASGTGSVTATLATVNTNTGSFGSSSSIPNFSVNGKGLITAAGGNAVVAPAGTLSGTTLNSTVVSSSLTSLGVQAQALNMGTQQITAVVDPTTAQMAATKNYVDTVASALNPIQAVSLASAVVNYPGSMVLNVLTITATGAISIDGTTPSANQRVLLKDQSTASQNGVYVVTTVGSAGVSPVLTRAADYNTAAEVNAGDLVPVISGTLNATTSWLQTATIVNLNTDSLVFAQWTANPANYLLKANNLSDVSTKATAYNNISPMTTAGDIEYEVSAGVAGRLAIGTANQALLVNAGGTAPSWSSGSAIYFGASTQITTNPTGITSGTFTTFSNSPAFSITPTTSGTYKVYSNVPLYNVTTAGECAARIINTSGSATLLYESQQLMYVAGSGAAASGLCQSVYTLTAGNTYVFDIQGKAESGTCSFLGGDCAFYMFAEQLGYNIISSVSSSLIGAMTTYGIYA